MGVSKVSEVAESKVVREMVEYKAKKGSGGTSLVVQGLRIRLPTQATRVRSLVRELRSHVLGMGVRGN